MWTEKETYKEGDKIKIFMKGNKDFYARILYIDSQGNKILLIPNQHRTDNKFEGGKTTQIPEKFDNFELEVSSPFGIDQIILYASITPQGEVKSEKYGDSLYKKYDTINTVGMSMRGVKIKSKDTNSINGAEFFELGCKIITSK